MHWDDFAESCPEFATMVRDRLARDQVLLLGTLRRDGSPRISALECDFAAGRLLVGMIWQSVKALDLLRDPRMTAHSWLPGKESPEGDFKLYGRAEEISEPAVRRAYEEAIFARIEWRPPEPYHAFALDIESAGFVRFGDDGREVWRWRAGAPLEKAVIPVA
jgi:hypothetical protein